MKGLVATLVTVSLLLLGGFVGQASADNVGSALMGAGVFGFLLFTTERAGL